MIALLQIRVLDRAVQIDRIAIGLLELIQMQRAIVHCLDNSLAAARRERDIPRDKITQRIHETVRDPSHGVADGRGAEKRKHEVRTRLSVVVTQSETEIVRMLFQPEPSVGGIEES